MEHKRQGSRVIIQNHSAQDIIKLKDSFAKQGRLTWEEDGCHFSPINRLNSSQHTHTQRCGLHCLYQISGILSILTISMSKDGEQYAYGDISCNSCLFHRSAFKQFNFYIATCYMLSLEKISYFCLTFLRQKFGFKNIHMLFYFSQDHIFCFLK